jgi:predicted transcriptional regulator
VKTAKDEVRELLQALPDDASLEDIQYHLYVRQKIQRGLEAADKGRTITHEEAVRRMSRWLEK